jgi:hydroxyacylglutathione hydrolase
VRQIYPDLWQTTPEHPLPGFPSSVCHAYLLVRKSGNVLFYSTGREAIGKVDDRADHDRMEELGGVGHMLLCHWHEASRSVRTIKERFAASILSHARDAPPIEKESGVAPDLTFWDRQMLLGDIEAIPTPGHTVGSACYQYRSLHGKNYLFTGDTIWPAQGAGLQSRSKTMRSSPRIERAWTYWRRWSPMWCSRLSPPVTRSKRLPPPNGRPRRRPQR